MVFKVTEMCWTLSIVSCFSLCFTGIHSFNSHKTQRVSTFWKISIWQVTQWIYRTFLSIWVVWTHSNGWCVQSPLQLSTSSRSYPSNPHQNTAPWGWLLFLNLFYRRRLWATRSLGNMCQVTWAGTDLLLSLGDFLHPQLSPQCLSAMCPTREAERCLLGSITFTLDNGGTCLWSLSAQTALSTLLVSSLWPSFHLQQDRCISFWNCLTTFSDCFQWFLSREVHLHLFSSCISFLLLMPALRSSLHHVSHFDHA